MLKRVIALAIVVTGTVVGGAVAPAVAQQYPPADNSIAVSDTTPTPGQTITVTARTFSPGAEVTVTLGPDPITLGRGNAGEDGVLRTEATIPADTALGDHTVTAAGQAPDGQLSLSARITVVSGEDDDGAAGGGGAGGGGGDGSLPRTGSDLTTLLVQIGLALAALGGLLLALSRRRRRTAVAATGLAV